jgi:hypothetical protein
MREFQDFAMKWFANAEQKNAVTAYLAYRKAGLSEADAVAKVEDGFRATQNPSDSLEESALLRRMKQGNWSWMLPYIGQTMITRNLAIDAILGMRDPKQRASAAAMLGAVGATMIASEVFRSVVRTAIHPVPQDEEMERRRKNAMNILGDAMSTLAPGVGDELVSYLSGQQTDKGLILKTIADTLALPQLGIKAAMRDSTQPEIEDRQWANAAAKTLLSVSAAAGLPTTGGIEQLTQALIEQTTMPTKSEAGKRQQVAVMDSLGSNPTRSEFEAAVRLEYKAASDRGEIKRIGPDRVSFAEYRNRYKNRVIRDYGEDTARRWGFTVKREKKEEQE